MLSQPGKMKKRSLNSTKKFIMRTKGSKESIESDSSNVIEVQVEKDDNSKLRFKWLY